MYRITARDLELALLAALPEFGLHGATVKIATAPSHICGKRYWLSVTRDGWGTSTDLAPCPCVGDYSPDMFAHSALARIRTMRTKLGPL